MKGTKTSLFLLELMIALLLFSFCAAICVQLFHASNKRTRDAEDLSKAVFAATTIAEVYKSSGGDIEEMAKSYDFSTSMYSSDADTLTLYFGEDWNPGGQNPVLSAVAFVKGYEVKITDNGSGSADITVSKFAPVQTENVISTVHEDIFSITVKAVVS